MCEIRFGELYYTWNVCVHSYTLQQTTEAAQYAGEVFDLRLQDRNTDRPQFFMSAVPQDRLALYLTGARSMLPRPSRVLQAPIADRGQGDRTRAREASIRPQQAATTAVSNGYTVCRRLSSLSSSTAFAASCYSDRCLPLSIRAVAVCFCRAMLYISAAYSVVRCLSVRLSTLLSRSYIVSKRIITSSNFFTIG